MQLVLVSLGIYAALYLAARYIPFVGEVLTFPFAIVGKLFLHGSTWLEQYAEKPMKKHFSDEEKPLLYVLNGLLLLVVGLVLLTGDGYSAYLAFPFLMGVTGHIISNQLLDQIASLLFVSPAILVGVVCMELFNKVHVKLFPRGVSFGKWFTRFVVCLTVLSIALAFSFFMFRATFLDDPLSDLTTLFRWLTFGLLGIVVPCSAILAFTAVHLGLSSLVLVFAWIGQTVLHLVVFICQCLADVCDFLCSHFTTTLRVEASQPSLLDQKQPAAESQAGAARQMIVPTDQESEKISMAQDGVGLTFNGTLGGFLVPGVKDCFRNVKHVVRFSGRVDRNNPVLPLGLGRDVSALSYDLMKERIIEACSGLSPMLLIHVLDASDGLEALPMLCEVKRRQPNVRQVVVTAGASQNDAPAFLHALIQLHKDQDIATTFLVYTDAPIVKNLGEVKFRSYVSRFLADFASAHLFSTQNMSPLSVIEQLSAYPFHSLAIATSSVTNSAKKPIRWAWLKPFSHKAVVINVDDLLCQGMQVAKDVMGNAEKSAWYGSPSVNTTSYLWFDVPVGNGSQAFQRFEEENNQAVKAEFPFAHTMTIAGNPVMPLRGSPTPFQIGCVALFPVQLTETLQTEQKNEKPIESGAPAASESTPVDTLISLSPVVVSAPDTHDLNGQPVLNGNTKRGGRPRKKEK